MGGRGTGASVRKYLPLNTGAMFRAFIRPTEACQYLGDSCGTELETSKGELAIEV